MKKEIKIFLHKVTTKTGKTFDAFHCFDKTGNRVQVKFTQDCENTCGKVKESCILIADSERMNYNKFGKYPTLWVRSYESTKPLERDTTAIDENF